MFGTMGRKSLKVNDDVDSSILTTKNLAGAIAKSKTLSKMPSKKLSIGSMGISET